MSTSSDEASDKECPLCMETLELDDINFYPCKCEYQICRFCWHRIRTDENGLCPACRQPYPEDPVNFKPMTSDDVKKHKDEQRMKKQAEKLKLSDARQYLCNYRVLQKNLVYVVGLSPRVSDPEILKKNEYFGRYGKIQKIVTSEKASLPAPHLPPSHTAYVTYKRVDDALRAIIGVHNSMLDGRLVKASLGTTKYCSSFLNSRKCFKPECMYLHENAEPDISFTKDDMHAGKHTDYEKRLIDALNSRAPPPQSSLASQLDKILAPTGNTHTSPARRPLSEVTNAAADVERSGSATQNSLEEPEDDANSTNTSNSIDDPAPSNPADETVSSKRSNATARERQWSERDEVSVAHSNTPPTDPEGNENEFEEDARNDVNGLMSKLDIDDDRLDRLSFSDNDYIHTGIPAPAKHQEAPAPLMQWEALLGITTPHAPEDTIIEPSALFPTFKTEAFNSQSLFGTHTSSLFRKEPSPPPGLGRFNSDDDLGFDPFTESSKGLSALLREEQEQIPTHNPPANNTTDLLKHSRLFGQLPEQRQPTQQFQQNNHHQSHQHHHPMQHHQQEHSFLQQLHAQQQHQQQQYAADMSRQQDFMFNRMMSQQHQQHQQQPQRSYDPTPSFSHQFGNMQHHSSQPQQQQSSSQSSSLLQELFNRQQQAQHQQQQQHQAQQQAQQQQQMYAGLNSYMYNDMMQQRVPFGMAPPPGLGGSPGANRPTSMQQGPSSHMAQHQSHQSHQQQNMGLFGGMGNSLLHDHQSQQPQSAQDAFKALLPNVNVRFMDDSSMARWSHENSLRSSAIVPPPPGFASMMNR